LTDFYPGHTCISGPNPACKAKETVPRLMWEQPV
jgi:hypothetical protein